MGRKLSEVIAEIQQIEADGGDASELRSKVIDRGWEDRLPPKPTPQAAPEAPEPTFLENWGRPIAETGGALIGGFMGIPGNIPGMMIGAGLGGEAAGQAYDLISGAEGRTPQETVMGTLFNTMGGPTPPIAKAPRLLADTAYRSGLNLSPSADDVARKVSERGGTTTPGQRGSGMAQRVEGALESSPFAGPIMERNRRQTSNIFGDLIDEISPTATSREAAGDIAGEGFEYNKARAEAMVEEAYRTFDDLVEQGGGRAASVPATALQDLSAQYKELVRTDGGFAELVYQDPDLRRAIEAIDDMVDRGVSPSYDVLKRLRTTIGKKIDFNSPGSEQLGLKQLYDTLTADLTEGALELGGEAAQNAGRVADSMFSSMQVQLRALDPVFKYADTPSKMYDAIGRTLIHNPKLAESVRTAIGENAWDTFRDTWIRQNTRATPRGQDLTGMAASPHTTHSALANLKRMSPEGYAILTRGREEGMAVVERLADMMREGEEFINRSRTGTAINTSMFGGDLIGGTLGALAGLAGGGGVTAPMVAGGVGLISRPILSKLTAKALTSKRLNDALVKVGRQYEQLPVGQDLIRALVVAGADEREVQEIFDDEVQPPLREAANVY